MKLKVICDYCGKEFYRDECRLKGKKHHFCCKQCLADYSNKSKNPEHYDELKDFTNISKHLSELNREINAKRMTIEVRTKLRNSKLNKGTQSCYCKLYGKAEHRVVAEQILGRNLKDGEVVHHIDGNRRNNNKENLMVFSSQSEHIKFHHEVNEVLKLLYS